MPCQVTFSSLDIIVPGGSLTPAALIVRGVVNCQNSAASSVDISTNVTGAPVTIVPDPNGSFTTTIPIPITVTVRCGEKIALTITGHCKDGSTCTFSDSVLLDCGSCGRAQLSATGAPCVSGRQPITLNADICIPAGKIYQFQWNSGMAAHHQPQLVLSAPFSIDNTLHGPSWVHAAPPTTFTYPPGNYTAKLVQLSPPPGECAKLELPITAQCGTCPAVTGSVVVGPCDNAGHRPVTYTLTFAPPIAQGATASAVISYGGQNTPGTTFGTVTINASAGPVSSAAHATTLPPSPNAYFSTATVNVTSQGQTCPPATVAFNSIPSGNPPGVIVDTCLPCPSNVTITITAPANTANWCVPPTGRATGVATMQAAVIWPTGVTPPNPTKYDWTVTFPDLTTVARNSNVPALANGQCSVDTSTGWTGPGSVGGAIDLNQVGTYSVAVVAKFPPSAGLPSNSDGTPACNLTGADSFPLAACQVTVTPPCPSITISATNGDCVDPGTGKSATINFVATVSDPAGLSTGITWTFGDPASGAANTFTAPAGVLTASHPYSMAGSFLVTAKVAHPGGCKPSGGSDTASLTLTVTTCPCPAGMVRDSTGKCVKSNTNGGGSMSIGCWILLILALTLGVVACILAIIAACTGNIYLGIAAGVVAVIFFILLFLWLFLCASGNCAIFNWARWIVIWILMIAPIIAIIVALTTQDFICGLVAVGILWAHWGTVLGILDIAGPKIGCALTAPPFP